METVRINWTRFQSFFARHWEQGQHVSIIGPTGRGKSTLAYAILPLRQWSVICGTKIRDETLTTFSKQYRYRIQQRFRPTRENDRYIVWPKFRKSGDEAKQQTVFRECLQDVFEQGGWCLYVDETWYFEKVLRLGGLLETFWSQSRSNDITFVAATQRPRNVPLMMYDQCTHLFLFKVTDAYARKRLGEIGGIDSKVVANEVAQLQGHEFMYIDVTDESIPRIICTVE